MRKVKRRGFIKDTLMAGAAVTLAPAIGFSAPAPVAGKKVIVAGAGITGLCCAYELMKSGHEVVVLEATGRYGGHVFTGRDGLSDGLYTDLGADHITKPGYERFFAYVDEFKLDVLPYPHAEGSDAAPGRNGYTMIDGKFYTSEMLKDPTVLRKFGFNEKEVAYLGGHPWYTLHALYLEAYTGKFTDVYQPFGVGYDDLDKVPVADVYKKEGASAVALRFLGGAHTSALYAIWRLAIMRQRGIPDTEGDTYRLKGGNEQLPMAFARRLEGRVRLNHPILAIRQDARGVTVKYKAFGRDEELEMSADVLVNCITLPVFKNIPLTPALTPAKQYVVDNLAYSSHPFYVFEASSRFWLEDGYKSINMEFEHPDISSIWEEPHGMDTGRVILKAFGPGGLSPQRVLAAFREVYPGKRDTIEQALTRDWTKDKWAPACEMEPFPVGEMHKFWPQILQPEGKIYFAGTYADNMSRGMESCIRSAQRVAGEINKL